MSLYTAQSDVHIPAVARDGYGAPQVVTSPKAQAVLDQAGITLNKNSIPDDPRSPFVTSGVRIGTPSVTT